MGQPQISIVMPVYNSERFVAEAVRSLLSQSFEDFELIIVEDGSTDRSLEIVEGFDDERIRIIKNETNRGIVFSRNRGLREIKGRYYAPFDSDDVALPQKFEKQFTFLETHPEFAMLGSWSKLMDENSIFQKHHWKLNAPPERIPSILLFRNYFVHSSILVRREMIPQNLYAEGLDVVEDYKFCIDIATNNKVWNYPGYLLHYRVHAQSAMRGNQNRLHTQDVKIYGLLLNRLKIDTTEKILNCIFAIKGDLAIDNFELVKNIHDFLLLILDQNKKYGIYDQKQLEKVGAERWLKTCKLAKKHHLKILAKMLTSPLTRKMVRI